MAKVRKRQWKSGGETREAWVADYFDQHGKRHIKTFDRKRDADAWLIGTQHDVSQGTHTADRASITVAEAADLWTEAARQKGRERSTVKQYEEHVAHHISPLIGSEKLSRLTTPRCEKFKDDLLATRTPALTRKILVSLKSLLSEAQRRGLVVQNAAKPVKIEIRSRSKRKIDAGSGFPTKAEVTAMIKVAAGRWRPLLVAAVFTGLRSSELRGLRWDDVDLSAKVLHVRQRADQWGEIGVPKSEAGDREVPLSPMVVAALKEWKLKCPRRDKSKDDPGKLDLVFPNGVGKVESHANIVTRGLGPVQVTAGVAVPVLDKDGQAILDDDGNPLMAAKYGMHAFRHFFASWIIEQGFSPKKVQALLGHSSIQMTYDVYGHLFPNLEDDHARFAAGELAIVG